MNIQYAEKWWVGRNEPINPINQDAARRRHEDHLPYVAVVRDSGRVSIVDIADDWVSMIRLDKLGRQQVRYNFKAREGGRLFLQTAYVWEYGDDGDRPVLTTILSFSEDGGIVMQRRDHSKDEVEERTTTASTQPNWELYPRFGEYDSIINVERAV